MNANLPPPTAKIYPFRRPAPASAGIPIREARPALDHRQRVVPTIEFGSGWYHEAAVQAENPRKP